MQLKNNNKPEMKNEMGRGAISLFGENGETA
jgi:hypothetical protein